ncbi:MAG: hypothetical protein EOM73_14085, partial [Bacteroidia bacterium]|nr:hypothetical protein [Bacteroidia bacterium]
MQTNIQRIDINGLWDFYYSPKKFHWKHPETLPSSDQFSGKMTIPGYWDDHYELFDEEDFFGLEARFNPDYRKAHFPMARTLCPHAASSFLIGTGFYRKVVKADFAAESLITFQLGPAMWGASLFCNRKFAGHFSGYSTASEFELTGLLIPGKENELILVVDNVHDDGGAYARIDGSHDGIPFGSRPGQHRGLAAQGYQSERGGIGGGASIYISGEVRIHDWFIRYTDGCPEIHVSLRNGHHLQLHWKITEKDWMLDSGMVNCREDELVFAANSWKGKLWSDRDPALYKVSLELRNSEVVLDYDSRLWGACELKCDRTQILVNGIPTYFRGITEHCYFPETTNPHFCKEKYLHDLGVFRKAGFNFIRCHTQCPPEPFYEACD